MSEHLTNVVGNDNGKWFGALADEANLLGHLIKNHSQGKQKKRHLKIYAPTREIAHEYFWRIMDKVAWRDGGV